MSGAMLAGSTNSVQRRFATRAWEWQISKDADLKEVHNLLQANASTLRSSCSTGVQGGGSDHSTSRDSNSTSGG